ncbi:hypothetical protein [Kutzneria sp. NPDC052558]|uniref:hypothetical protein n=1 Tax=Kutzneria sp. NPDC052558 TaxID=3364121 RepID=UPI0037C5F30D
MYVDKWFDDVRTWAEVVTGQDLDPRYRVYDAESAGTGLTFIEPPHDGPLGLTITTPRILPLHALTRDRTGPSVHNTASANSNNPPARVVKQP